LITVAPEFALIMKVGVHACEPLECIVARKHAEERMLGQFYWGYGGTLCHPRNQVTPLADMAAAVGGAPMLVMLSTPSKHLSDGSDAAFLSADGATWTPLPSGATVRGSRYALVCRALERAEATIDLAQYEVAAGPSRGVRIDAYLRGRVDKACARRRATSVASSECPVAYVAEIVPPSAVFLR